MKKSISILYYLFRLQLLLLFLKYIDNDDEGDNNNLKYLIATMETIANSSWNNTYLVDSIVDSRERTRMQRSILIRYYLFRL